MQITSRINKSRDDFSIPFDFLKAGDKMQLMVCEFRLKEASLRRLHLDEIDFQSGSPLFLRYGHLAGQITEVSHFGVVHNLFLGIFVAGLA